MFYLESRSALISGDALVTLNLLTGEHVAPRVPYRLLNNNDAAAKRSVAKLVLPGHGKPWRGTIAEAIETAGVSDV